MSMQTREIPAVASIVGSPSYERKRRIAMAYQAVLEAERKCAEHRHFGSSTNERALLKALLAFRDAACDELIGLRLDEETEVVS